MATNNQAVIDFNRNFVAGDKLEILVLNGGLGSLYTFTWVASPSVAFEVEVGTPTATAGETAAINFATAWENAISGFTVTQSTNSVTLLSDTFSFSTIIAKDSSNNTYTIPTDYDYTISTVSTGNKITYTDKVGTAIAGDAINQWRDLDANEVKTKHNLNDDRITAVESTLGSDVLLVANNLSDVANAATARANLNISGVDNNFTVLQSFGAGIDVTGTLDVSQLAVFESGLYSIGNITVGTSGTAVGNIFNNSGIFSIQASTTRTIILGSDSFGNILTLNGSSGLSTFNNNVDITGNADISGVGTFGTAAQANTLVLLGDTAEDLTITKNLDGTTTLTNTNNESFLFEGNVNASGYDLIADNLNVTQDVTAVGGVDVGTVVKLGVYTVATLPASPEDGWTAVVTDANGVGLIYRGAVSGNGSNVAMVMYDSNAAAWLYH